jgi:hypothetical protein
MLRNAHRTTIVVITLAMACWMTPADAQVVGAAGPAPARGDISPRGEAPNWGTTDEITHAMNAFDFNGYNNASHDLIDGLGAQRFCTGSCILLDGVDIQQGALVASIELDAFDSNASGNVRCSFLECELQGAFCTGEEVETGAAFDGGDDLAFLELETPVTIDNYNNTYIVQCSLSGGDSQTSIRAVRLFYNLQVSPAPPFATYGDVPTGHPFFRFVEALSASGITGGCGGGNFCPDDPITRGQMAVFLSAALGLHWPNGGMMVLDPQ